MRRRDVLLTLLFLVLAGAVLAESTRVARGLEHAHALRLEVGRAREATLTAATRQRLATLDAKVLVTYFVSAPEHMPSDRKDLERRVVDVLEAMRRAAPERFDYLIVDPDRHPELVGFASRRRVSPQRVRTVRGDAWTERTIWSSLSIAYGTRPEAVLHGIGPEHLPRLQETLVAELDQMEHPRRPVVALSAPPGFDTLAEALSGRGELRRVDLDSDPDAGGAPWPDDADLVVWIGPRRASPARLAALGRFLAAGRSVVVAGALLGAGPDAIVDQGGAPAFRLRPSGEALEPLLAELGVEPVRGLVCDSRSDALDFQGKPVPAAFLVRCIAPNQDFSTWRHQPNGTLLFTAPTPFAPDEERLRARGYTARVLATSSDGTWIQAPPLEPGPPLPVADLRPEAGIPVAKQPLVLQLVPDDPWAGSAVLIAAETPLRDGLIDREGTAHRAFVQRLLDELLSDERLVLATAARSRVEPLPAFGAGARVGLRLAVVVAPALAVLVLALLAGARLGAAGRARALARGARALAVPALGLVLALVLVRATDALGGALDATDEGLHGLAPETRAIARRAAALGPVEAELLVSDSERLPPALRPRVERLREELGALSRAGVPLRVRAVRPEDLDPADYAARAAEGLAPVRRTDRDEEETRVRTFHCALRLARGERNELLSFPDDLAFEELEFRLAFALWRLETGRHPRVAVASDVPRPSAAEAYENFQSKGLFAPTGVDVYSEARARLEGLDLDVVHVNPRKPELPEGVDALVWLQPRRSIQPMLAAATRYLVGGGNLLIAAQHFRIQARQYRGAGFEGVLWPQPQAPDLERFWLPELGIDLVREVLFDARHTTLPVDVQVVGRGATRVFERQELALPVLIRADASGFDREHPITRQLGDQAFVFGNRITWDAGRLADLGITARTLIRTSPETWSYAWKGGWVPDPLLEGPDPEIEGSSPGMLGPQPLAVLFEGAFPVPKGSFELNPAKDAPPPDRTDWPAPRPGRFLLVGSSEVFRDGRILDPRFRGDQLLVNAATFLALPPELAAIAQRRDVPRGFGLVSETSRSRWRAAVVAAGPLAVVFLVALWWLLRRRAAPLPGPAPRAAEAPA